MEFENYTWTDYKDYAFRFLMQDHIFEQFSQEINGNMWDLIKQDGLTELFSILDRNTRWNNIVDQFFEDYHLEFHDFLVESVEEDKLGKETVFYNSCEK